MRANRCRRDVGRRLPHAVEQRFGTEDLIGVAHEKFEQSKLLLRKLNILAVARDSERAGLENQIAGTLDIAREGIRPAQQCPHSS